VVPHALHQAVTFEAGEGPRLDPLPDRTHLSRLSGTLDPAVVEPVYQAVRLIKAALDPSVTFLGFCGAPWTVATYMVAGRGGDDQEAARLFAYRDPEGFAMLIGKLIDASITYLSGQIAAGVDAVQIFDTWAGVLPDPEYDRWCVEPIRRIVAGVKAAHPNTPVIVFPKGAGARLKRTALRTGADGVGVDQAADKAFVAAEVQPHVAVQGDIDPMALLAGGPALDRAVDAALAAYAGGRYIFNLGHGITPPTPITHVEQMLKRLRG
jgi:uroporphyrinogen decarboxylase